MGDEENGSARITIKQVYEIASEAKSEARAIRVALSGEPGISLGALEELRRSVAAVNQKLDEASAVVADAKKIAATRRISFREGMYTALVASCSSGVLTALIYVLHLGGVGSH